MTINTSFYIGALSAPTQEKIFLFSMLNLHDIRQHSVKRRSEKQEEIMES